MALIKRWSHYRVDYVNYYPAMKAAMHALVTASIVINVFKWSRDMESTRYPTLHKLLMQVIRHMSTVLDDWINSPG